MRHSIDRILTTHCGSLPRSNPLIEIMTKRVNGQTDEEGEYLRAVGAAVTETVARQRSYGIDIVNDGEQSKLGFQTYIAERLEGFETRPGNEVAEFAAEVDAFPEYYKNYFRVAMEGGAVAPSRRLVCRAEISYTGQAQVRSDVENLRAALGDGDVEAFITAVAPSGVGSNEYYASSEDYLSAVAAAMQEEYRAIVDAGFLVQIDDPFLTDLFSYGDRSDVEKRRQASLYVEAVNEALTSIPQDRVRYHTCYGINEGPRVHDAPLQEVMEFVLQVNAGAYSFEGANARHEHEYHLWERLKLPDGKILIPGVITHTSNVVEHPELVAERIARFAALVGKENVIAGVDCGFSSQASALTEVNPRVIWAKLQALAAGAELASSLLWR